MRIFSFLAAVEMQNRFILKGCFAAISVDFRIFNFFSSLGRNFILLLLCIICRHETDESRIKIKQPATKKIDTLLKTCWNLVWFDNSCKAVCWCCTNIQMISWSYHVTEGFFLGTFWTNLQELFNFSRTKIFETYF